MTISYTAEVAQSSSFGCFFKLLLRWRASIYKLIWLDVLIYIGIYYAINATYRFILNKEQKKTFEMFVKYCNASSTLIPLMFVLGFYVSIVVKRWWEQYMTLPWPDSTAVYVSSLIRGQDENGRKMRRTIMRYVCLSLTLALTMISPRVKRRFPTLDHLVDAGLLVENEKIILKNINEKFAKYPKHWMPIVWAASIVTKARKEGRIRDDSSLKTLIDSLNSFRGMCMVLLFYDTISIPLVYTQVVTIAVYTYFLTSVFGHQWMGETDTENFLSIFVYFFPVLTVLEYLFFMGWLKVAESLICPFGDDDDDFEVNWLIDRNIQVSYMIVDEMHNEHPDLIKDQYWDEVFPQNIPHETEGKQSTADMQNIQPERRTNFKFSLRPYASHYFTRGPSRSMSTTGADLNEAGSDLTGFFGKGTPIVAATEDEYQSKSSVEMETSDNEFEKLKKQRQQERLLRQVPIFTINDKSDDSEDVKNAQGLESKSSTTSHTSSAHGNETKKNI